MPELTPALCRRWSRSYGSLVKHLLDDPSGLGLEVAPGLHEAELRYLCDQEWARDVDDVLWRRSKLGLFLTPHEARELGRWMEAEGLADVPPATESAGAAAVNR